MGCRDSRRQLLLAGVSALALIVAGTSGAQARPLGLGTSFSASTIAANAAMAAAQQAAAIAKQSQLSLGRALQSVQAMQAAQTAARQAARAAGSSVPDGLVLNGLVPDSGLSGPGIANPVTTWVNANTPVQTTGNGQTTVTIQQTAPQALLNWSTFNVGMHTIVDFKQQGNSSWIALNKINDPSGVPSQIFGQIKADGQVYLINRNGIIFGGSSQINVGTLVASALPINDALVNAGTLFNNPDQVFTFSAYNTPTGVSTSAFQPGKNPGDTPETALMQTASVTVEPGATISTLPSPTHSGGRVVLIGPQVSNAGSITTPDGQTILAAGQQVALLPHASTDPSLRGLDVFVGSVLAPAIGINAPDLTNRTNISTVVTGIATNSGLIEADRGNITIAGATVNQLGAVVSTTSVSLNGRVDLVANYNYVTEQTFSTNGTVTSSMLGGIMSRGGLVTLGSGSVVQILPELASTDTVLGTSLSQNSQINVTGSTAYMAPGAQIFAPGALNSNANTGNAANGGVTITATGQIYIDSGASIDVSGSIVTAPVTENIISVQLLGAQLANSPLQRNGPLRNQTIFVDIRQTGLNPDGSTWIGTPLADATGFVGLIQRKVGELTTAGGSITLNGGQSVTLQQGSLLNVSGGYIDYQGGFVATTRLVGADGHLYDISKATPDRVYLGILGGFTVEHARWNVTEVFASLGGGHFDPGYIQGGAGGSISIGTHAAALDGDMVGLTVTGPRQRQTPAGPGALTLNLSGTGDVILQSGGSGQTAAAFNPVAALDPSTTVYVPTEVTGADGFGSLTIDSVNNTNNIAIKSDIVGQAGGSIALSGNAVDIEANITVPSGSVSIGAAASSTLTLGSAASVNVAGLIVDDRAGSPTAFSQPLLVNGGSVSLGGGSLHLDSGSLIDASGGVAVSPTGKLTSGNGGSIALASGFTSNFGTVITATFGDMVLGATLKGYGVGTSGKGGSISVETAQFQIGGSAAPSGTVVVAPDFFNQGGFANFTLIGIVGLNVMPNTVIEPVVQSYLAIPQAGSGVSLNPVTLPVTARSAVSLTLRGQGIPGPDGPVVRANVGIGAGARIELDPTGRGLGNFTINGSNGNTASILGSIIVPGGNITISTLAVNGEPGATATLGPGSLLSTAGTVVTELDSRARPFDTVLGGGSIAIAGNIFADTSSVIDVSGTTAVAGIPTSPGASAADPRFGRLAQIDSNGGSVTLNPIDSMFMGAVLRGAAGGPTALGGSLTVTGLSQVTQHLIGSPNFSNFAIDSFEAGHFASLTLAGGIIDFTGPVAISAARSLTIATGTLMADSNVTLSAPYVALGITFAAPPAQKLPPNAARLIAGSGTLTVAASDLIDVGSLTVNTVSTSLTSLNDIRGDGTFQAAGNVTITAGQIYPITDTIFTIAAPGMVKFAWNGNARSLPFSAAGQLNVFAGTIIQDGVLRAPLGTINLGQGSGTGDGFAVATTVSLGTGSVTSVSAIDPLTGQGMSLPYGLAPNDTTWTTPAGVDITAGALPGKVINLTAASVAIAGGATIDLRGGGDLFAYNFVKGLGGTNDILASPNSFAVIPGYQFNYAPVVQIKNATGTEAGWSNPGLSVGDQITLATSTNGLAAGTYTLLPARYALMAGAFLVTQVSGAGIGGRSSIAKADGSSIVSGTRFNALNSSLTLASQPSLFEVAASAQVKARAQYDVFSANTFLAQSARANGAPVPRLPVDAGVLALSATASITINGQVTMSTPPGGLGGVVTIASSDNIQINNDGTGTTSGTLFLSAPELSQFGADVLIIGSTLSAGTLGPTLTATTGSIEVKNDAAHALSGSDVVLMSKANLTLDTGAVVEQNGSLTTPATTFFIGNSSISGSGNGALLRVSADANAQIIRTGVKSGGAPNLVINDGAQIKGAGVILDSTGSASFVGTPQLSVNALTLGAGQISVVLDNPGATPTAGLVLPQAVVNNLQGSVGSLALTSYTTIDFYGTGTMGTTDAAGRPMIASLALHAGGIRGFSAGAGEVTLNARTITIDNSVVGDPTKAVGAPSGNSGSFVLQANTIAIGANNLSVTGYSSVALNATNGLIAQGTGSFTTAGDLVVTTPVITAAGSASQTISAGGTVTVNAASGPVTVAGGLGASLTLSGTSIADSGNIVLPSGSLTLHATAGDVTVGGSLDVSGIAQKLFDQTKYTNGGQITLTSDTGNVTLAPGSFVTVAAQSGGGNAGSLSVSAGIAGNGVNGVFSNQGRLLGQAGAGGVGGSFTLDANSVDFDPVSNASRLGALNAILDAGGFSRSRDFRVRTGDVTVDGTATASNFTVSADSGTITVTGWIDASGVTGGTINLYAYKGVTIAANDGRSIPIAASGSASVISFAPGDAIGFANGLPASDNLVATAAGFTIDANGVRRDFGAGDIIAGLSAGSTIAFKSTGTLSNNPVITIAPGGTVALPNGTPAGDNLVASAAGYVTKYVADANGNVTAVKTYFDASAVLSGLLPGNTVTFNSAGTLTPGAGVSFTAHGPTLNVAAQQLNAAGKGGSVDIETGEAKSVNGVMTSGAGWIDIQRGSIIDLSVAGGPGGTLHLRAPQLANGAPTGAVIVNADGTTSGANPTDGTDVAIKPINGSIVNASSIVVEGFQVFDLTSGGGTITTTVEGNVNTNAQNFANNNTGTIDARLLANNSGLASVIHIQPGEELVTRSGDMTLPQNQDWNFNTYRYGPNAGLFPGSGEPGVLTLRAAGNLVLQSSLTDGFMPIQQIDGLPVQDYASAFGLTDPTTERWNDILLPAGALSWSYRLVAGADLSAVDFHKVVSGGTGSVQLGVASSGGVESPQGQFDVGVMQTYYQVVRTGTGDIDVAAANDVQLLNPFASIYTAGTQVTPVATSTLNPGPGGSVQLAANIPIVFPNAPGGDTVTAIVPVADPSKPVGFIIYRPSPQPDQGSFVWSVPTLPAGTVFTFPSGFVLPLTLNGATPLVSTALVTQLTTPAGSTSTLSLISAGSSISGFPAGLPISMNLGATMVSTSSGTYNSNGTIVHFTANVPFTPPSGNGITFDNNATLTVLSGGVTVTLPGGSYKITAGNSNPNFGLEQFTHLPPGATLQPLDKTGGGLVQDSSNVSGGSAYLPMVSVVAKIPVLPNNPTALYPGSNSVTLTGNYTLSLGGTATSYSTAALSNGATSYQFDTPNPLGAPGPITAAGSSLINDGVQTPFGFYYLPQYSTQGGNVSISAGRDIIHMASGGDVSTSDSNSLEMPSNWLYRRSSVVAGQFATAFGGDIASTSWWVDFSNFTEGVGALGGGNVTLKAGRDVYNVDAVIPTNAWMPYSTTTTTVTTQPTQPGTMPGTKTTVSPDGTVTTTVTTTNNSDGTTTTTTNVIDTGVAKQPLFEYGGGNLSVSAGRNINGGVYYVEKGNGTLSAGGAITTNSARQVNFGTNQSLWLPTTLFLGKGSFTVSAGGDVLLDQIANALMVPQGIMNGTWDRTYFSTYAPSDTVDVASLGGSVTLRGNALGDARLVSWMAQFGSDPNRPWLNSIDQVLPTQFITAAGVDNSPVIDLMPPTLRAIAFSGNINLVGGFTLAPSPSGTVSLLAAGSINGLQQTVLGSNRNPNSYVNASINLSDADPASFPNVNAPLPFALTDPFAGFDGGIPDPRLGRPVFTSLTSLTSETGATLGPNATLNAELVLHDRSLLHFNDTEPVRIYAVSGDVTGLQLFAPKSTDVFAGRDITDITFYMQNLHASDTSAVIAGRDIIAYDENSSARQVAADQANGSGAPTPQAGDISIGGPGVLDIFAGRNLSVGNAASPAYQPVITADNAQGIALGMISIGNARNPSLPANQGASITAGAGIDALPGTATANYAAFLSAFLDPASAGAEATRNLPYLATMLGIGDPAAAWAALQQLPVARQQQLALDIFYMVLRDSGRDHNDPNAVNGTRNYEVGFRAVSTLFPGSNYNGDISLTGREIKTAQGGNIDIIAPGGQLLVGFDLAGKQPLEQGIMTLESGDINIFARDNVTVGTSKIFTFRGGNEIIWSSTGNIAAGAASKTLVSAPPQRFIIDPQTGSSTFDPGGLATGGGIGVLQTIKGAPPGNVDLIAPAGFVDAGDAGIRVSGNLNIAALQVLNAFNIQVGGATTGIPVVQPPPVAALTSANNVAGSATKSTEAPAANKDNDRPSIIIVEFLGFGGGEDSDKPTAPARQDDSRERRSEKQPTYNVGSAFQIVGIGAVSEKQKQKFSPSEQSKLCCTRHQ